MHDVDGLTLHTLLGVYFLNPLKTVVAVVLLLRQFFHQFDTH
jgi:hypothetical protein